MLKASCAKQDVLVTINGAANLKCPTHSSSTSTSWFVPGSVPPISKDNTLYTDNNRISITGNPKKGEYNLRISNFQTSDVGIYMCTISFKNVAYQHEFNLLIGKPPKNLRIENFENQSTVQKIEGEELILKCTVESGQPKEILRFEKNGHIIKESNTSTVNLTVNLSHTDHQSRYTCKAISTALNVSLSQTITVNVFYAPQVNLGKVGESLMIKEGNNLTVNCIAEGNPKPYNYTWMYETTRPISTLPAFIINVIQRKDAGLYSCVVTNKIGSGKADTNVVVMFPPDPPVNVTFFPVENGVRLEWMANFNGGFKQSFFIEYREQNDDMWQKVQTLPITLNNRMFWTIGNLQEDRTYSFRMFSRNKIGDSNKTKEFHFNFLDEEFEVDGQTSQDKEKSSYQLLFSSVQSRRTYV
ncbi:unnamed protein product [Mytilus edulis]|uniref:Uncharacterized protein n=1 Tax=Mytilus edulis TaxID=6550 RepID=A0A8S3UYS5_MYTED|nr:unnamed protein product [Mytilus edulis]